jgi:hypothetical protein
MPLFAVLIILALSIYHVVILLALFPYWNDHFALGRMCLVLGVISTFQYVAIMLFLMAVMRFVIGY